MSSSSFFAADHPLQQHPPHRERTTHKVSYGAQNVWFNEKVNQRSGNPDEILHKHVHGPRKQRRYDVAPPDVEAWCRGTKCVWTKCSNIKTKVPTTKCRDRTSKHQTLQCSGLMRVTRIKIRTGLRGVESKCRSILIKVTAVTLEAVSPHQQRPEKQPNINAVVNITETRDKITSRRVICPTILSQYQKVGLSGLLTKCVQTERGSSSAILTPPRDETKSRSTQHHNA